MRLDAILRSYADHGEAHIEQISRTLAAQYADRPDSSEEFFANLTREWSALFNFLSRHESEVDVPVEAGWSAKDHVAHITAWETFLLRHHLGGEDAASALELTPKTGVSSTSVKATVPSELRAAARSPMSGMPVMER